VRKLPSLNSKVVLMKAESTSASDFQTAQDGAKRDLARLQRRAARFQRELTDAKSALRSLEDALDANIATINTGVQKFQTLSSSGVMMDFKNLTQQQLADALDKKMSDLRDKISKLEAEFGGETFGAVAVGVVGPAFALANFWNPIGWLAGIGVIVGEVFMGLDLEKKREELDADEEALAVAEEEKAILAPMYTLKAIKAKLATTSDLIVQVTDTLNTLALDYGDLADDLNAGQADFQTKSNLDDWSDDSADIAKDAQKCRDGINELLNIDIPLSLDPKIETAHYGSR
jgi:DNA repair exonuclease SbcCD ATPase subunit